MPTNDLESVINDAVSDSVLPDETPETPEPAEVPETPVEAPETPEAPVEGDGSPEVPSPGAAAAKAAEPAKPVEVDEFEKKFGIPRESVPGRENRIPYSRVKKIVEKAQKDLETSFTPKIQEYETKIKDYDSRFQKVAQFEHIMVKEQPKFLQMLRTIPGYAELLDKTPQAPAQPEVPVQPVGDQMPEPDQALSDGSKVYSMDGLKKLMEWQTKVTEARISKQVEERYKPIESQWQAQQRLNEAIPIIQAKITEARKWPLFNDNEEEIVKALQTNQDLTLDDAYRQVVFPKLTTDRNKMREELLKEIKSRPAGSTSTTTTTTRPVTPSTGPRSLEDIIGEQVAKITR